MNAWEVLKARIQVEADRGDVDTITTLLSEAHWLADWAIADLPQDSGGDDDNLDRTVQYMLDGFEANETTASLDRLACAVDPSLAQKGVATDMGMNANTAKIRTLTTEHIARQFGPRMVVVDITSWFDHLVPEARLDIEACDTLSCMVADAAYYGLDCHVHSSTIPRGVDWCAQVDRITQVKVWWSNDTKRTVLSIYRENAESVSGRSYHPGASADKVYSFLNRLQREHGVTVEYLPFYVSGCVGWCATLTWPD